MLSIKIDDSEIIVLDCKCNLVKTLRSIMLGNKAKSKIEITGLNSNVHSK